MTIGTKTDTRNVLPRWRFSRSIISLSEISDFASTQKDSKSNLSLSDGFNNLMNEWNTGQESLYRATELVSLSCLLERKSEVAHIAMYLEARNKKLNPAVNRLLHYYHRGSFGSRLAMYSTAEDLSRVISELRKLTRDYPRNPLHWFDLGLAYTISGDIGNAEKPVRVGLALAPYNRFALRSASRYFMHCENSKEAHRLLVNSGKLDSDPWIMSAEIAVALSGNLKSVIASKSKRLAENVDERDIRYSELFSALASLEYEGGSMKWSKRYYRKSIINPTENAMAQYVWAIVNHREMKVLDDDNLNHIKDKLSVVSNAAEARYRYNFDLSQYKASIEDTKEWLDDQPFSSRPAGLGSYVSCVVEDYGEAKRFAERGYKSNPKDSWIINNLAFAELKLGQVKRAEKLLQEIEKKDIEHDERLFAVVTATLGMLDYKSNRSEAGYAKYLTALDIISGSSRPDRNLAIIAVLNLCANELDAGNTQVAASWFNTLKEKESSIDRADIRFMLRNLQLKLHKSQAH